ncbi:uncharacterized protein LOC116606144 [Nematostella vectensis]|uniref:uncharacterized protein LOC116606144 n=1 Tax=Nematostella vectensis TaxID=45351 RepID=UPI002077943F|nr:uncharacterized protein LOC116606144 [Nematostella vectensis]
MAAKSTRFPSLPRNNLFCFVFCLGTFLVNGELTCDKIDVCSCRMSDGSGVISLWEIDGGTSAKFKNIPQIGSSYVFSYNPCTAISDKGCKNTHLCQSAVGSLYSCGTSEPKFSVASDKSVQMFYEGVSQGSYERSAKITLNCDKSKSHGSFDDGITETTTIASSEYSGTLKTKCACPNACKVPVNPTGSSSLSVGSIILIVFFPLVFLYFVLGTVINIYVRKKEGMPDVIPYSSFWCDLPFLIKDGGIFFCGKVKFCCLSLCAKCRGESYTEI